MTNEKTNPMPYRAEDAAALLAASGASDPALPDMAAPVITPDDVARGTELLRRYKDGKRALEARRRDGQLPGGGDPAAQRTG